MSPPDCCRAWLDWAATQVDLCLTEDKPACDRLMEALTGALEPPRANTEAPGASAPGASAPGASAPGETSISGKMAAVVVAVQSHDRVMQQLTHVRDALRLLHTHLGDPTRAASPDSWRTLREMQMREFTMAEERALFARLVAPPDEGWLEIAANPDETVEIFITDAGLRQP
ncbi:MAG TPA: hypothetical protein VGI65_21235 [Steroidobacteraceae bacterium]|jgi:hypothetical protein